MTTIQERRQSLSLDAAWHAVKWDASAEFIGSMETAFAGLPAADGRAVKGVDVIAARNGRGATLLLLGEFKDFAHPNIPTAQRAAVLMRSTSPEIMRDVVAKVIDSLCGATFAHDSNGDRCDELIAFRGAALKPHQRLLVLYCAELPKPAAMVALNTELKRRLRWLGPNANVIVTNGASPYVGNGVSYAVRDGV